MTTYSTCSKKYFLHYKQRLRSKTTSGALLFGSSIDKTISHLLETKDLVASKEVFKKSFSYQPINNVPTYLQYATNITYSQRDWDADLLTEESEVAWKAFQEKFGLTGENSLEAATKNTIQLKKEQGFNNLTDIEKRIYNFGHWHCLLQKGYIMLESYNKKLLPRIKKVLALQKPFTIENPEGDKITGFIDLIAEWEDGKIYVFDTKTSSMKYEDDSALRSQQLIVYYYAEKENYELAGVGYHVLYKQIAKNRQKICSKCMYNGSGTRYKTCSNEISGERCNGDWREKIFPEADIDVIISPVTAQAEELVISAFDLANDGIKKEVFNPNLLACKINENFQCQFLKLCWTGDDSDLIKLGE